MANEVRDVPLGHALRVSLDHYYDLLKTNVGSLQTDEFLQLKLVADPIDISKEHYEFFSYYTMLVRSDVAIEPSPIDGESIAAGGRLHHDYGRFIQRLRSYVVRKQLSDEDQKRLAVIDLSIERMKQMQFEYFALDMKTWRELCEIRGTSPGDGLAYFQWSSRYGYIGKIEQITADVRAAEFDRRTILDRAYAHPDDRQVIDAESAFESPGMRLRYPLYPDNLYDVKLTLQYLANLDLGSTALFDDRRAVTWDKALETLKTAQQGSFSGSFDKNTGRSESIATDWRASGSAGYWFLKVRASVSDHKAISEEFSKVTKISMSAESAFRATILWPDWFQPHLFTHRYVQENPKDFLEFFGARGTLRYYPTALILVRGFKVTFESSQNWTYDYERKFNASVGGGFRIFGINFGGSTAYGSNVTRHKFDRSTTKLTIADDASTLRFVGLAVKETKVPGIDFTPVSEPGEHAKVYAFTR